MPSSIEIDFSDMPFWERVKFAFAVLFGQHLEMHGEGAREAPRADLN